MTEDIWSFALDLYAQPGVEAACLELQEAGADVCLLLAGAWFAARGLACSGQRLDTLAKASANWQREVVKPLRTLRQQWKTAARNDAHLKELRETLKTLELRAERLQLERLAEAGRGWTEEAGSELDAWLQGCAGEAGKARRGALQQLRTAAASRAAS
ncbi:TIGR02444 family protein [Pseudomonas citronellolis]|uniref:TIGR02444 family protein n=1 Tax=Pseudomonas citronellolis TaxID=53408 RepID=A0A1A9K5L3_9PSED|nr:TIGR02444 family protein [Pseudomonas citronellolis]ANI12824.1 TIGR02444 family protein [Pseudomonas citronellolis]